MRFLELLKKEIKQERGWFLYGLPIICAYELFLLFKTNIYNLQIWLPLAIVPIFIISILVPFKAVSNFRREWQDNSVQTLFALPLRGYHFVCTKFITQALLVISYSFLSLVFLWLIAKIKLDTTVGITFFEIIKCWWLYWLFALPAIVFFIFSYIIGRCVRYVKGLVSVLSFIAILYGFKLLFPFGRKIFGFLPKAGFTSINPDGVSHGTLDLSGLFFFALFGVILLVASSFMIEKAEI